MSRAKLQGQAAVTGELPEDLESHFADLSFQIDALNGRCDELGKERNKQIGELAEEVQDYRQAREGMEQECAEITTLSTPRWRPCGQEPSRLTCGRSIRGWTSWSRPWSTRDRARHQRPASA